MTPPTIPPQGDARTPPKISDETYLAMRNILTPEKCRALLDGTVQAHTVIYDLYDAALLSRTSEEATAEEIRLALSGLGNYKLKEVNVAELLSRSNLRITRTPGGQE